MTRSIPMHRPGFMQAIDQAFEVTPVVAILGPRQCGKTTMARAYTAEHEPGLPRSNCFDLEDATDLSRLADGVRVRGLKTLVERTD